MEEVSKVLESSVIIGRFMIDQADAVPSETAAAIPGLDRDRLVAAACSVMIDQWGGRAAGPGRWTAGHMDDIRDDSYLCAALQTRLSRRRVARLFARLGWDVRKCTWTDYEVCCPFAELTIEAESPILLHGPVADVEANADRILAVLRDAGIGYTAENYNAGGSLLREFRWEGTA
jgi:hypothetical protein